MHTLRVMRFVPAAAGVWVAAAAHAAPAAEPVATAEVFGVAEVLAGPSHRRGA